MSVAFNKFQPFVANLANGVFNLGSDSLKIALTNTVPVNTNTQLSNLTEISYTNCSARTVTTTSSVQASGTYKLILVNLVLTSSGTVGPFQYIVLYDDTSTNKNLIGYWDYGSALTLNNSDTLTITFDGTNGVVQIT
jgi:hypothetical protein